VYQNLAINIIDMNGKKIQPPMRVLPGRLSVRENFTLNRLGLQSFRRLYGKT
jgi:hypothetical protein